MGVRFGVEHEFVVSRGPEVVDFRDLIHSLTIDGLRIDPVDSNAYRLQSGVLVTCDGPEAEVATPPIELRPGFAAVAHAHVSEASRALRRIVPEDHDLMGGSTHISVSVDDDIALRAAGLFARTFAPALMLLLDGPESPGLLVRPRYGRVEIGGEYAAGPTLTAALTTAIGGVLLCRDVAAGRVGKSALPAPLRMTIEPAVLRYGWYIDRRAFNTDLYGAVRETKLRREIVGRTSVDKMLRSAWRAAERALGGHVAPIDIEAAAAAAAGTALLPTQTGVDTQMNLSGSIPPRHPLGRVLDRVDRGSFAVEAVVAAWDFTVLRVYGRGEVFVTVPAGDTEEFLAELHSGALDEAFEERLTRRSDTSVLHSFAGATRRAVYDSMPDPRMLAVPERGPSGRSVVAG